MPKTKPTAELLSDQAFEILVWPAKVVLRCDHAGAEIPEGQEPDVHEDPARLDAAALVRHRYATKCDRFGVLEDVALGHVDDPLRICPGCGFNRTIVRLA